MEAVAKLRNCPLSARKMRLVADLVRGKKVEDAVNILKFTNKEAAGWLEKLVLSAVTNWENKTNGAQDVDQHDLFIKTLMVDDAGHIKRIRPAPQGRAHRIRKHSNHVTVIIENRIPFDGEKTTGDEEE
ncbi:MAG: 50S ribosomal protein L22 [Saprospiraceae bacterium]|jgi:large subunit ribosomal protein L22|nr:50S ribosomal protein L22 [Candidatus Opimibacter skivensis]MBL0006303.1 50S ribosomal protein L22 [Candidatus Opimibacter skivensis]HQW24344.1 50S ribosomal protein L22 [Saprospiraceae bacterium]